MLHWKTRLRRPTCTKALEAGASGYKLAVTGLDEWQKTFELSTKSPIRTNIYKLVSSENSNDSDIERPNQMKSHRD